MKPGEAQKGARAALRAMEQQVRFMLDEQIQAQETVVRIRREAELRGTKLDGPRPH